MMLKSPFEPRTCWNCAHLCHSSYGNGQEEPEYDEWECQHPNHKDRWEAFENLSEPEAIVATAADCPGYQYQPPEPDYEPEPEPPDLSFLDRQ